MRRPRALLYDDDPAVLEVLRLFFEDRGFEVIAHTEPVACPVYGNRESCDQRRPCGDLMITDLEMPRMSGLELIRLQASRGCPLGAENKAVLSGRLDAATSAAARGLGCAVFRKPCRLAMIAAWTDECLRRADLTRPLASRRREDRVPCGSGVFCSVDLESDPLVAEVVNRSDSGLCVRLDRPLAVSQVLSVQTRLPLPSGRLEVRWTRPDGEVHLAGMSLR